MADELNGFFVEVGAPIAVKQFASLWKTQFLEEHPLQDLLFAMMRSRGVHILDNFPCFFTTAHSEADFRKITQAYKESVLELQEAGFLPRIQRYFPGTLLATLLWSGVGAAVYGLMRGMRPEWREAAGK